MRYAGSKNKIATQILKIIERESNRTWLEPFVGGCGMIRHVQEFTTKVGCDSNKYIISLWKAVQRGYVPPTSITKEEYLDIKNNPHNYDDYLVGFVGYACSFGGAWFNGYAKNSTGRNYATEGSKAIMKFAEKIKDVEFINCDYRELNPRNKLIYCDPPYADTKKYSANKDEFDHGQFWNWCRKVSADNSIYISEYTAPDDFVCIAEFPRRSTMDKKAGVYIEKLFVPKNQQTN